MMSRQNLNHSYRHFADLQLSAQQFYTDLEAAIKSYQFPDVIISRRAMFENGIFERRREYLCVSRGELYFYVCAAPYGKSYFISWWFQHYRDWFWDWLFRVEWIRRMFENREDTMFKADTRIMFESSLDRIISELAAAVQPHHGTRKDVSPTLN